MKKLFLFLSLSLFILNILPAQHDPAMEKAWTAFMTPGENHKWIAKSDGIWNGEARSYMDPTNQTTSQVTATNKMIYNGLYQVSDFKGTMMGAPFEGHGILAYDNAKQEFVNTWIDNMGSGIVVMRGQYDPKTKTLNMKGVQTDPLTKKETSIRQEILFIDDNTQVFSLYGPGAGGKEMKMMDIRLTRAKL